MRLNQFIATASGLSRRQADDAIASGRVRINSQIARLGQKVSEKDIVTLDGNTISLKPMVYLAFHKPIGFVCSRRTFEKSKTIYSILPSEFADLKTVGRLDRESSGLIILTNDGQAAFELSHPSRQKVKRYNVQIDKPLTPSAEEALTQPVVLSDGPSKLIVESISQNRTSLATVLTEGRNRQVRRTLQALGYEVVALSRSQFGKMKLGQLKPGQWVKVKREDLL